MEDRHLRRQVGLPTTCLIAVVTGASFFALTLVHAHWALQDQLPPPASSANLQSDHSHHTRAYSSSEPASVLDCEEGVYSPVQNKCVDRAVFDMEVERLLSALGISQ